MVFHSNANILSDLFPYRQGGGVAQSGTHKAVNAYFSMQCSLQFKYLKFAFEQTTTVI